MIKKFLGWGRKCYYSYNKIDKKTRFLSYVAFGLSFVFIAIFALLLIKKYYFVAAILYSFSWLTIWLYFKYINIYHKNQYEIGNEIFMSEYSKRNIVKTRKTINVMIGLSCFITLTIIFFVKSLNQISIREVVLLITTLETVLFIYFSSLMNFQIVFYEEYYTSIYYIIPYNEISKIKIIKEINTIDGVLNWCEITFKDGEKSYDKFFNVELNILNDKVWKNNA